HRLGASQLDRTICATAGGDALITVVGRKLGTEPEAFRNSKYIIAWAANIHGNNIHLWPFIEEARRNGAKLVVIDPYLTRTARSARRMAARRCGPSLCCLASPAPGKKWAEACSFRPPECGSWIARRSRALT